MADKLHTMSFMPVGNSPTEMGKFLAQESARWRAVIAAVGIKPE